VPLRELLSLRERRRLQAAVRVSGAPSAKKKKKKKKKRTLTLPSP
jgi:hypothetical protein